MQDDILRGITIEYEELSSLPNQSGSQKGAESGDVILDNRVHTRLADTRTARIFICW